MTVFRNEPEDFDRLDFTLLQNGAVTLYFRPQVLAADVEWLKDHGYRVDSFNCSASIGESEMHGELSSRLEFPGYYGRNLNALNDCISDLEVPDEGGRVLVFNKYDSFAATLPHVALSVLDIMEDNSRQLLLFGKRLIILVQSDDPAISFERVGGRAVMWNSGESLNSSRGL